MRKEGEAVAAMAKRQPKREICHLHLLPVQGWGMRCLTLMLKKTIIVDRHG